MNEVGIKLFEEVTVEYCKNCIKERQNMMNDKINDRLKLCLRIKDQEMYEREAQSFLDDFKKREILYKNEKKKVSHQIRLIEEEKEREKQKNIEKEKERELEKEKEKERELEKEKEKEKEKAEKLAKHQKFV